MRAARDLRPEGIVWPEDEEGRPIFTLVALARANGISHESAHDAMSDVQATVDLARLVRSRQPKLYEWYWSHRTRDSLRPLIDLVDRSPLVHSAAGYTSSKGCTTLVAPVAIDPENRNQLVAIDLRFDPSAHRRARRRGAAAPRLSRKSPSSRWSACPWRAYGSTAAPSSPR